VAQVVLNQLFALTPLQSSFGVIFLAIVDGQPRVLPLTELLRHFLDHRRQVVVRRTKFDLKKAEERAHLLLGLALALADIDRVIAIIRGSKDPAEAKERLTSEVAFEKGALERFLGVDALDLTGTARLENGLLKLDAVQAQAILEMRLQRLTGLEREKIVAEYRQVLATIADLKDVLARPERVTAILRAELEEVSSRFGSPRRTEIAAEAGELNMEDLIAEEEVVLTVTRGGYAKRTPLSLYRAQRRGGKGRTGAATKEETSSSSCSSRRRTTTCSSSRTGARPLGEGVRPPLARSRGARQGAREPHPARGGGARRRPGHDPGVPRRPLRPLRDPERAREEDGPVRLRKSPRVGDHRHQPRGGRRAPLGGITDGNRLVFLGTRDGMGIKFSETDVRPMGRDTTGVKGIELREGDVVVEMDLVEESSTLLAVTARGYGKRTDVAEYRHQGRGGTGVINVKVTEKNGAVVGSSRSRRPTTFS